MTVPGAAGRGSGRTGATESGATESGATDSGAAGDGSSGPVGSVMTALFHVRAPVGPPQQEGS